MLMFSQVSFCLHCDDSHTLCTNTLYFMYEYLIFKLYSVQCNQSFECSTHSLKIMDFFSRITMTDTLIIILDRTMGICSTILTS